MKEIISYFYKINVVDEIVFDDKKIFKTDNSNYLYEEIDNPSQVLYIHNLNEELNKYKFFSYRFKTNIFNEIVSKCNGINFVLIDIGNKFKETIDLDDMLTFYQESKNVLNHNIKYKNNWDILWENKINYLSSHFDNNKLANKNSYIVFNYYISIAEISLQYLLNAKKVYKENNVISFSHRRIYFPTKKLYFYNPLNFVIDLEIRDISEYIKSLYYSNEDYITELNYYLKTHKLDGYLSSLLYARIIYPSNFFDDYESGNIDLNKYFDFSLYEKFIKKIYDVISSYILIDRIDFLN